MVVDPTDTNDMTLLNVETQKIGMKVSASAELATAPNVTTPSKSFSGIFYRPQLPYRLSFQTNPATATKDPAGIPYVTTLPAAGVRSIEVFLPNKAPIVSLDIERASFVKNSVKLHFEDGTLVSVAYNKPSQLAGLIQIPVDLANTLLSAPNNVLTLRYQNMDTDKRVIDTKNQTISTQQELITNQQALSAQMKAQQDLEQQLNKLKEAPQTQQ